MCQRWLRWLDLEEQLRRVGLFLRRTQGCTFEENPRLYRHWWDEAIRMVVLREITGVGRSWGNFGRGKDQIMGGVDMS